jgi:MATE family multidrug resistance protein
MAPNSVPMPEKPLADEPRWEGMREISRLAFPIILGMMSWTLMQFVDNIMVARVGKEALAAVGSAGIWSFLLAGMFIGVCSCVATFVAQSIGRGRPEESAQYTWHGVYIALFGGVAALALWPAAPYIFGSMGHSEMVTQLETVYFQIRLAGFIFLAWAAALTSFFQAIHRPMIPSLVAIGCNILNGVLDYLLIFGYEPLGIPRLEVAGAAWATVIATIVNALVLHAVFVSAPFHREYATRARAAFRFQWRKLRELTRIGVPAGLAMTLDIAIWGIFISIIVGRFGDEVLAAQTAVVTMMHVSFMPAVGLNHAITAIVGKYIGAEDIPRAKARAYTATRMAAAYMIAMGLVFAFLGGPMLEHLFDAGPEVVRIGRILFILAALFQGFDAINIVISGALRGAGDTRYMAIVMFIAAYAFFLPCAAVFAFTLDGGAIGAWIAASIYIIALSGILLHRFASERWRGIEIFEADAEPRPPSTAGA